MLQHSFPLKGIFRVSYVASHLERSAVQQKQDYNDFRFHFTPKNWENSLSHFPSRFYREFPIPLNLLITLLGSSPEYFFRLNYERRVTFQLFSMEPNES